ncbi:MAG: hypothetical protein Q8K55_01645 [Gemmatimonadaceae bacterium]|nr:hypothetical protein [Gemmatimonadaceae bacterium]
MSEPIRRELRREVDFGPSVRAHVMRAVRHEAAASTRRGWLSPLLATALAAGLVLGVIGSPLANRGWPAGAGLALHRDSVLTVAIRDTLALVRFSLIAPRAARVELVGDFNAWRTGATRLERDARSGEWEAQIAMVRGRHRYAFVVDDTQWVVDTAAPSALAPNGRPASRFVVPNQD